MPRTKAPKKTKAAASTNESTIVVDHKYSDLEKAVNKICENQIKAVRASGAKLINEFETFAAGWKLVNKVKLSRPMPNINDLDMFEILNPHTIANSILTSTMSTMNTTRKRPAGKEHDTTDKRQTRRVTRSRSATADDGYLTADSQDGSTSKSISSKSKKPRRSRSLSRTRAPSRMFKTPSQQNRPPVDFGTVTPKMKPNEPQVIFRRPKVGEVAISMQGSPLLVNPISADYNPNINIPLGDGNVMTIMPTRGLRASRLPELSEDTRQMLAALRDNLDKLV